MDVNLVGGVVGLGRLSRDQSYLVAFRRERSSYACTSFGSGAEDENYGRHGKGCGRRRRSSLVARLVLWLRAEYFLVAKTTSFYASMEEFVIKSSDSQIRNQI